MGLLSWWGRDNAHGAEGAAASAGRRPATLALALATVLGLALYLVAIDRLGRIDRHGPAHADVELDGGVPGTLYLPGGRQSGWLLPTPPLADRRPPGVILLHAYAADRKTMSVLAWRLTRNGYVVLAVDLPGHGGNRNRFPVGFGRTDALAATIRAAADYLRASAYVDSRQLALVGHSMGAIAALDYLGGDRAFAAVVAISGALPTPAGQRPPNTLLLLAESDPQWVRRSVVDLAARLSEAHPVEPGRLYGDFTAGTALKLQVMGGVNHLSIVWSAQTAAAILEWLDSSLGVGRMAMYDVSDARVGATLATIAALLLLLPALGVAVARLTPAWEARAPIPAPTALAWVSLSALLTVPILGMGEPLGSFLAIDVADLLVPQLGIVGLLSVVFLSRGEDLSRLPGAGLWLRAMAAAMLGLAVTYALWSPLGILLHALTPTPERFMAGVKLTILILPLFLGLDFFLRRGSPWRAALTALAGRLLVLGVLTGAGLAGLFRPLVVLMLPPIAILVLLFEIPAWPIYTRTRNPVAIAMFEALLLAWMLAVILPIRA